MGPDAFLLPPFFDFGATFCWAISGALVGARRGYDIVGIFIIAMVSSTGGGLLRDGLFLQDGPPVVVRSPTYLQLVAGATVVVMLFGRRVTALPGFQRIIDVVDALGLGAYAVVGMNRATALGLGLPGVMLVGMVNAVGGAVLRSVLVGKEPHLFRPGAFEAVAALIGCAIYLVQRRGLELSPTTAAWTTIVAVLAIRLASVAWNVHTRALHDFRDEWGQPPPTG
ncbi:MAG: TRIC cation channel family protein [Planctomyces sp.]|nr:TRIC cation channel family protein [Planctomyces sp.]